MTHEEDGQPSRRHATTTTRLQLLWPESRSILKTHFVLFATFVMLTVLTA